MDILEARLGRADLEEALSASIKQRETASNSLLNSTTGSLLLLCPLASAVRLKTQTMLEGSIQQLAIAHQAKNP